MTRSPILLAALAFTACGGDTDPADEARAAFARGDYTQAVEAFDEAISASKSLAEILELELVRLRALSYVGADDAADEFLALAEDHREVGARAHIAMVRELIEAQEWTPARTVAAAARARFPRAVEGLFDAVEKAETRALERARAPALDPNISSNPYVGGVDD